MNPRRHGCDTQNSFGPCRHCPSLSTASTAEHEGMAFNFFVHIFPLMSLPFEVMHHLEVSLLHIHMHPKEFTAIVKAKYLVCDANRVKGLPPQGLKFARHSHLQMKGCRLIDLLISTRGDVSRVQVQSVYVRTSKVRSTKVQVHVRPVRSIYFRWPRPGSSRQL